MRPSDLKNVCLTCKQLREIAVRPLNRQVALEVGSQKDVRLAAFLNPRNAGLRHIRKLDVYLADPSQREDSIQLQRAHFAVRMIIELLPENILEEFSWHTRSPFDADNLLLLYRKQTKMRRLEGIALDGHPPPDVVIHPQAADMDPQHFVRAVHGSLLGCIACLLPGRTWFSR